MKLVFANVTDLNYLGKRIWEKEKDGHKESSYYVSVDSSEGFGSFVCDLNLFNSIGDLPKYTPINMALEYDSFDRSLKVVGLTKVSK